MNGLGWTPLRYQINLTAGDWIFSRTNPDGVFPPGTAIEIKWGNGETWPGTVDGDTVSWRVESETVALVPQGTPFTIWVRYPNAVTSSTDDYPWVIGTCRYIK
ncbi:hypothetical protein IU447_24220 [Nocardia farcinica]|uniref:LtfC-like domain-containing protein n=1 Tax=Nocardia farcinica TaxID=37329 RepID=UPI001893DBDF|nr:hypothetical protein [Nocardia farcinica]MBF6363226.1 hypothetical protein [Nocardia farcinica]